MFVLWSATVLVYYMDTQGEQATSTQAIIKLLCAVEVNPDKMPWYRRMAWYFLPEDSRL